MKRMNMPLHWIPLKERGEGQKGLWTPPPLKIGAALDFMAFRSFSLFIHPQHRGRRAGEKKEERAYHRPPRRRLPSPPPAPPSWSTGGRKRERARKRGEKSVSPPLAVHRRTSSETTAGSKVKPFSFYGCLIYLILVFFGERKGEFEREREGDRPPLADPSPSD